MSPAGLAAVAAALAVLVAGGRAARSPLPAARRHRARTPILESRPSSPSRAAPPRTHLATAVAALAAWALAGPRAGPLAALAVAAGTHRLFAALPSRADADRDRARAAAVPLFADLVAACLAAGAPPDAAIDAAARAVSGPLADDAAHAIRATRLGVPARTAWAPLLARERPPPVRALARALTRSDSGAAPAHVLRAVADDARTAARTAGEAAARRAAVTAVLPLGLCFLPAFVLAGVVPLVAGLLAHSL